MKVEAIKKRLQTIKLVPPSNPTSVHPPSPEVGTDSVPVPGADLLVPSSASESVSGPYLAATWITILLEVAAPNLREAKMGAEVLNQIPQDLLSGAISQTWGRALLQDHAQRWFPHTRKSSKPHCASMTSQWSKCDTCRANYATIQ